jgi:hypothetical protein
VAAVASVNMRFRRARGVQRQQLKWFTYAVALVVVVTFASDFFPALQGPAVALAFPLLPVAACVAILKYRLYDIDRIINRTLVYALLTATLGFGYFALVAAVSSVAGDSSLSVAVATLAVAALFQPLRRRIQALIDRRFYRSKYDAEQTLADFSAKLRDDIDLDHLTAEMASVVRDTLQPSHFSLWLRRP